MDYLNSFLFWIHLVALAMGGVATFGIPVVGSKIGGASPETRPVLFSIVHGLSTIGRTGLGLLIITGPLLVWLKYNGTSGFTFWFWVKMVLVVILLGLIIFAGINTKRGEGGDVTAAKRGPLIGMAAMITFLLVVAAAVLAFG
jgi:protoporphyrinogen IX oxidase